MPKCLQCPQYQQNQFNCIDCIYNSTTWYLEPVCKYDLKQRGKSPDDVFNISERSFFDIDLYIVNDLFSLQLMLGCESFCDPKKYKNCNKLNITYLGQDVYVLCKNGFSFQQNACVQQEYDSALFTISNTATNCSAGTYLLENFCYKCPNYCTTCLYDQNKQTAKCQSCKETYTIQNDACVKCGANCKYCQVTYDSTSKINYLQCLKCIDDSLFFLSASQTNCLKNEISGCQYVLQRYKTNFLYSNTYPSTQNFITVCTYCNPLQIYSFDKNMCVQDPVTYTEQNICLKRYQSPVSSFCYLAASSSYSQSFYLNCSTFIAFCNLCQKQLNLQTYICIQCNPGFYANRLTGFCQLCPQELVNCEQCGQQQILQQDYWIYAARAFMRQVMELQTYFEFLTMGQSQNAINYEVICLKCKAGYALHKNKCIQFCFQDCQECILNNDIYECVKCGLTERGRMLTVINNQCIECPEYCSLCRLRSDLEIKSINQLFNNQNFTKYTRQCLKSYDDDLYSYDSYLGQFIKCSSQSKLCENEIQINLNLYCDLQKYQQDLNNCQDENERQQFYRLNILYEDLFSSYSFQHFENYYFYLQANVKLIKSIVIKISSSEPQYCSIGSEAIISQRFGENIFSVLNVSLILNFAESTTFKLEGSLNFYNFNSIYIKGIRFVSNPLSQNNILNFASVYPQDVKLIKISFEASKFINFQLQIIFENLKNLEIHQANILNLNLIESIGFIKTLYTSFDKLIIIKDFTINNSSFTNMNFFEFNLGYNDKVLIANCNINGHFLNSSFIVIKNSLSQNIQSQNGIMEIEELKFVDIQVKNTNYFIDIEGLRYFALSDLSLSQSQFSSSYFLNSCIQQKLTKFNVYDLKILKGSILIMNSNFLKGEVEIILFDISFTNVELDEISHFIKLQKFYTAYQSLRIKKLSLSQNYCKVVTQILPQIERSQIYLNFQTIYLEDVFIQKNYGITELSIFNSQNVIIKSSYIYQESQFGSFGLHKNLICLLEKLQQKSYPETIIIFSTTNIDIQNMTIYGISSNNSPFLLIKSAELELASQQEIINLIDFKAKNNLLIQSDGQKQLSLFQIKSSQQVQITLTNSIFENNILHQYQQNNLKNSACLINIDCELCNFHLRYSNWINNTVINGTDSIMYVNAKEIILEKNAFISNSIFYYELIQPYLFWEFQNDIEIYMENIEEIFSVKSLSGNGWFLAQNLYFHENDVKQSMGMEGGAFKIEGKNNSIININDLKLEQISTLFQTKEEYGGALYIDGYNAQQIQILLINIEAKEIFCQNQGGLIYIHVENIHSEVNISNINFVDVIAYSGSFLFCEFFFKADHNQVLYINKIQGKNTQLGLEKFLNKFSTIDTNDILNLASNKSLIHIDSGTQVIITQFLLQNSFYESLIIYDNALKISFSKISVLESSISNYLIQIIYIETQSSFLTFSNSMFFDLEFSYLKATKCDLSQLETPVRQFFCSNNFSVAPKQINSYSIEQNFSQKYYSCLLNNINTNPLGLILLNGLTNLTQQKNLKFVDQLSSYINVIKNFLRTFKQLICVMKELQQKEQISINFKIHKISKQLSALKLV